MNPSSTPGRSRRAPAFRTVSIVSALLLANVACSRERARDVEVTQSNNDQPQAETAPRAPEPAVREGGTGTRAKGEEPRKDSLALPPANAPVANAPSPLGDVKRKAASGASGGIGLGLLGSGSGQGRLGASHAESHGMVMPAPTVGAPGAAPKFNTEAYASVPDNAFLSVKEHPLSTFSSDVDTASYSNARRFLTEGQLPPKDSIRVEEWLNYFSYGYAPPEGDAPVAIHSEVSECPWQPGHRLVRIGVKARPIEQAHVPPRNLVFLVDVSGSMQPPNKLPLLKNGLALLARTLRAEDRVAIVVYAGSSGLVLPPTSGDRQDLILAALGSLEAGGSTNGGQGIELAYKIASEQFAKNGINRVLLATDGDFNVGTTSEGELVRLIEEKRKSGVFLTVLGFGDGNVKDATMELLADKGNGNYAYIDRAAEARRVLVREAGATLVTVAKDVKLQVEFNPARVQSYRLVGYENRLLADQDFNDDKKDAGDMGAGHSVTALYEVVPVGAPATAGQPPPVSPLKYQSGAVALAPAAASGELMTVSVRYKAPAGNTSEKLASVVVDSATPFASASPAQRFAAAVAEFAQILRGSPAVAGATLEQARSIAAGALTPNATGDQRELVSLIDRARSIGREPLTRAE